MKLSLELVSIEWLLCIILFGVCQCSETTCQKAGFDCHEIPGNVSNSYLPVGFTSGTFENFNVAILSFPLAVETTLIFHEFYESLSVNICDAQFLPVRLNLVPANETRINSKHCQRVDLVRGSVIDIKSGEFFVQIARLPSTKLDPERGYLKLLDETRPNYNLTYVFQTGLVNYSLIENHHQPCEANGIPELRATENGTYSFFCDCKWGTTGERCQWGSECQQDRERELCANRGSCRQRQDKKVCFCDQDHHGPECAPYTWFREDQRRSSEDCHYYHVLPVGSKCSCRPGYDLSPEGKCVEGLATLYFNYTLVAENATVDVKEAVAEEVETCFPNISTNQVNIRSHIHMDEKWTFIEIRNINFTMGEEIWKSFAWNSPGHFCEKPKRITREQNIQIADEVNFQNIHMTPPNVPFEPMSSSIEKFFLEIYCCHPGVVNFTFYKDNHVINEEPVNSLMTRNPVWSRGTIHINALEGKSRSAEDKTCMCLKISNYDKEDMGEYHCKIRNADVYSERYHYVSAYWIAMELTPATITVNKGDNATVRCEITGVPITSYAFNISWQISSGRESYTEETMQLVSKAYIENIQSDVTVKCEATEMLNSLSNKTGRYLEKRIRIRVVEENQSYCEDQSHPTGHWGMTLTGSQHIIKCPKNYYGNCSRMCSLNSDDRGTWDIPNCSKCRNRNIHKIFKAVRMYRKGIHSYLKDMEDLFPNLAKELRSMETVLPGEMGNILAWMMDAISSEVLTWKFDSFNEVVNLILRKKFSVFPSDFSILMKVFDIAQARWTNEGCDKSYFKGRNLISFVEKKVTSLGSTILLSIGEEETSPNETNLADDTMPCTDPDIVRSEIQVFLDDQQTNSSMIAAHLIRRPTDLITHLNLVHSSSIEDEEKTFGKVASPLVYLKTFTNDTQEVLEASTQTRTTLQFLKCTNSLPRHGNIKWNLDCGRYNMEGQFWNTTSCSLKSFPDGACICSCMAEKNELVGLFCLKVNITRSQPLPSVKNGAVAGGSGISITFLLITSVFLSFECTLKAPEALPRLVEVLSLMVVHFVFFYESLVRTDEAEHLALLIAVSAGFVLSLGISVSHQVSLLQKSPAINSRRHLNISMEPAFLVIIISVLCSLMLGFILWTICTVQNISLSHTWLPDRGASILTLVVLCYICGLLLLLLVLVAFNYLRVRKMQMEAHYYAQSLYAEYRNKCITNVLHFILILTSFYQEDQIGRWFFFVTCVLQSGLLMVLYTRQTVNHIEKTFKKCCLSPDDVKRKEIFKPMKKNDHQWKPVPGAEDKEANYRSSMSSHPSTSSSISTNHKTERREHSTMIPKSPVIRSSDEESPKNTKPPVISSPERKFSEIICHEPPTEHTYYAAESSKPVEGYLTLQPAPRDKTPKRLKSIHPLGTYMNVSPNSRIPTDKERSYMSLNAKSSGRKKPTLTPNVSPERRKNANTNL